MYIRRHRDDLSDAQNLTSRTRWGEGASHTYAYASVPQSARVAHFFQLEDASFLNRSFLHDYNIVLYHDDHIKLQWTSTFWEAAIYSVRSQLVQRCDHGSSRKGTTVIDTMVSWVRYSCYWVFKNRLWICWTGIWDDAIGDYGNVILRSNKQAALVENRGANDARYSQSSFFVARMMYSEEQVHNWRMSGK